MIRGADFEKPVIVTVGCGATTRSGRTTTSAECATHVLAEAHTRQRPYLCATA